MNQQQRIRKQGGEQLSSRPYPYLLARRHLLAVLGRFTARTEQRRSGIQRTMRKLYPGDPAPDFSARTSDGRDIRLSAYRGQKNVVLYFYPKDFTPGCTSEACSFRDAYDELQNCDTEVIGVSLDDDNSHVRFAERYELRFPLVSDPEGSIARSYGALGTIGGLLGMAMRKTFVIDRDGIIRATFHHELRIGRHVQEVKEALTLLRGAAA